MALPAWPTLASPQPEVQRAQALAELAMRTREQAEWTRQQATRLRLSRVHLVPAASPSAEGAGPTSATRSVDGHSSTDHSGELAALQKEVTGLREAMDTSRTIGLVMALLHVDRRVAMSRLTKTSTRGNAKLRVLAEQMLTNYRRRLAAASSG